MYRAITRQIEVTVEPNFMPESSSQEKRQFFWSYTVVITNAGKETSWPDLFRPSTSSFVAKTWIPGMRRA
jgi:hypothetical protein